MPNHPLLTKTTWPTTKTTALLNSRILGISFDTLINALNEADEIKWKQKEQNLDICTSWKNSYHLNHINFSTAATLGYHSLA